jgi:hypothetical protein
MPESPSPGPPPLSGPRLWLALAWIAAVVLLHLAVRELGIELVR